MLKLLTITFFTLISLSSQAQVAAKTDGGIKEQDVEVVLGIDKVIEIDFTPSTKAQIGNESILSLIFIPQKRQVTFKGKKAGKTSVILRDRGGDIKAKYLVNITASDQSKVIQEIRDFLDDVEGLEIGIKGNRVFVGGQIVVPDDIGKVVIVLENYEDVINLVELSPQTQRIIAKKMQDEIRKNNIPNVTVRVVNGLYWLEGVVNNEGLKAKAEAIAIAYIPAKLDALAKQASRFQTAVKTPIQNFISVNQKKQPPPAPKQVKITAQFVELTKDYNKVFGFMWQPMLTGSGGSIAFDKSSNGGVTTRENGTLSGTISQLFPKLSSAKSAGYARVIQSGSVITENNVESKISRSTTKPFALGTNEFSQAQSTEAGFNMTVTPSVLSQEKVKMKLGISVKSVIGSPPETLNNSISTSVIVKSKDSAVIGGVVVNKSSTDYDRDPPGGTRESDDPNTSPFFSFLRSKNQLSQRSQFAIFITPEIIEDAAKGTMEIKRKFRRRGR